MFRRGIAHCFFLLSFILLAPSIAAQAQPATPEIQALETRVNDLRAATGRAGRSVSVLQTLAEEANRLDADLDACVRAQEKRGVDLQTQINELGSPQPGEADLVRNQRDELTRSLADSKSTLASCRALLNDATAISTEIHKRSTVILKERLLVRGTDIPTLIALNLLEPAPWLDYVTALIGQYRGLAALGEQRVILLVLLVAAVIPGLGLARLFKRLGATRTDNAFTSVLLQSVKLSLAGYIPYTLVAIAASLFFLFLPAKPEELRFWEYISYGLTAYLLFTLAVRVVFDPPGQVPSATFFPKGLAAAMAKRLRLLALLTFAGGVYFASLEVIELPRQASLLGRGVFITLFAFAVIWFVWLIRGIPGLQRINMYLRRLLLSILLGALTAEWAGYRGLSSYLLRGLVGSLLVVAVTWGLTLMLRELGEGLDRGKLGWQRSLRAAVGLTDKAGFPGVTTLRILLSLALWTSALLLLLKLWGVPDTVLQLLYLDFRNGFEIAGLHIAPSRIAIGFVLFALLLQVFSRLRQRIENQWLPHSHLDRGAREAAATISGYLGFILAILIALGVAGVDLSKLAIIAGALSVGIGFGLQNIVNNFISGLILLFERPIVPGDYVTVGNTEGHVRKISIRSTEIETLDRRSVIVPNSELISNQVTNWMRHDSHGRIKLEVGVAYGSDLRLVQEVLLGIVRAHTEIVQDGVLAPAVLLTTFADSAIKFTVVAVVRNFQERNGISSEVLLAVHDAFEAQGIEMSSPQRVMQLGGNADDAAD